MERITGIKWLPALPMVCCFFVPCTNAQTSQTAPAEGSAAAQSPCPSLLLALVFNWGPFPPPELPGLISTTDLSATPHGPAFVGN